MFLESGIFDGGHVVGIRKMVEISKIAYSKKVNKLGTKFWCSYVMYLLILAFIICMACVTLASLKALCQALAVLSVLF